MSGLLLPSCCPPEVTCQCASCNALCIEFAVKWAQRGSGFKIQTKNCFWIVMDLVLLLWAMSCNSIFELNTCSLAAGDVGQSNIIGSFVETHHFFSAAFCLCLSVTSWTTSKSYRPVSNHFCCANSMLEAETVKCSALKSKNVIGTTRSIFFFFFLLFRVLKNFWHHRVHINHDHTPKIS